jgi:hypothetical protein
MNVSLPLVSRIPHLWNDRAERQQRPPVVRVARGPTGRGGV